MSQGRDSAKNSAVSTGDREVSSGTQCGGVGGSPATGQKDLEVEKRDVPSVALGLEGHSTQSLLLLMGLLSP